MINEALPVIPIIADKNKTVAFFKPFNKSEELFIVLCEFPFCQTLDGRNLWPAIHNSIFFQAEEVCKFALVCTYCMQI